MLNVKEQIVSTLSPILPTYYELTCDSDTEFPCITYIEYQNSVEVAADTVEYSNVGYYIKLWTRTVEDIANYSVLIDSAMRNIGYKRTSSNEIIVDGQVEKIMAYQGLGLEILR